MSSISLPAVVRTFETELLVFSQEWRRMVASNFIGPLLYLGAMGFGLGSLVDEGPEAALGLTPSGEPITYLAFLAPALVAATGVQVASGEAIFGTMARTKWRRTWLTAVSTPLSPGDLALTHLLWIGARGALASVLYAVVAVAFGAMPLRAVPVTVVAGTLGGMALGAVLMSVLVRVSEEHAMNAANRFVVIPMFLFSGVFFPVDQLPGWLQPVAQVTPMWHGVVVARAGALGVAAPWGAWTHVGVLLAMTVLGLVTALRGFQKRLIA